MAIAFRDKSSAAGAGGTGAITLNKPATVQVGDVMLALILFHGGTGKTITDPAGGGWTLIQNDDQTTITKHRCYYRVVDGSEPASWTWNWSPTTNAACGCIVAYSGVATPNPLDVAGAKFAGGASATTFAIPTVTTITAGAWLIVHGGQKIAPGDVSSISPGTWASRNHQEVSTTDYHETRENTTFAGPAATGTVTVTGNSANTGGFQMIVLRPAAGGTTSVSDTLTASYTVRKAITDPLALTYNVRKSISDPLTASYNVRTAVTDPLTLTYNVRRSVVDPLTVSYGVAGKVSDALSASYNVRVIIADTLTASYMVKRQIADTLSASFMLRTLVSDVLVANYNVRVSVADALAVSYFARIAMGDALSASYIIRKIVTDALSGSYFVRTVSSDSFSASYIVRRLISDAVATSYIVRSAAADILTASYNVRKQIADSLALSYAVGLVALKLLTLNYLIRKMATDQLGISYLLRKLIADSFSLSYNLIQSAAAASDQLALAYNIRKIVADLVTANYRINLVAQDSVTANFRVAITMLKLLQLQWSLIGRVNGSLNVAYFTRQIALSILHSMYAIGLAASDSLLVLYLIEAQAFGKPTTGTIDFWEEGIIEQEEPGLVSAGQTGRIAS